MAPTSSSTAWPCPSIYLHLVCGLAMGFGRCSRVYVFSWVHNLNVGLPGVGYKSQLNPRGLTRPSLPLFLPFPCEAPLPALPFSNIPSQRTSRYHLETMPAVRPNSSQSRRSKALEDVSWPSHVPASVLIGVIHSPPRNLPLLAVKAQMPTLATHGGVIALLLAELT